jgi:hypothetical protein
LKEDGALFDSGFDDTGPFRVTPESGGVSLESALRDFGPAAIDDLIPRLRALAAALDAAHRAGVVHGALHPSKVFVTDEATSLVAGKGAHPPYAAPEVLEGHGATPMSDQYALAAIAYEWMFGRPLSHNGERPVDVRSMPGVDRLALSRAFTRALAPQPDDRFASCAAFCDALNGAIVPELPLLADVEDFAAEEGGEIPAVAVAPIVATPVDSGRDDGFLDQEELNVDEVKTGADEPILRDVPFDSERDEPLLAQDKQPDLDAIDPRLAEPEPDPVPAWNAGVAATPPARRMASPRFSAAALFLAVIVGAVFGFAAGYMARPRALQSGAPQEITVAPPASDSSEARVARDASEARDARDAGGKRAPGKTSGRPPASPASPASAAPVAKIGRLLVRSTPSGASVSVDGVARGETPLALRDLDAGTRTVVIARRGYVPETRRVVITKARPARTLEVRLASDAGSTPRPSTPATLGKPATSTGTLAVDSRPAGAAVTINGKPSGTTPLTLDDLAPGEYRIVMTMPRFHDFATTVRVVAGERVRAAASLTAVEQQ